MTLNHTAPILSTFNSASAREAQPQPKKKPTKRNHPPFSLRLSEDERSHLKEQAGDQPLGAYIRDQLLGDDVKQKRRQVRQPAIHDAQFATLLGMLGESRLASNLNQLAKHANCGTLDVSPEVEAELKTACAAVIAMRNILLNALGHRPPKNREG